MAFGANFAAICFAEDMLRDRIRINRSMWEIFRETDQLPLQLPARATVCRPDLLCLLFGEEVAAAFPCGASSRWLVKWQIDCAGRPMEKLKGVVRNRGDRRRVPMLCVVGWAGTYLV